MALAARDSRVVVSHDFRTMPAEFAHFLESLWEHGIQQKTETGRVVRSPGLFIVPQKMPMGVAIESLLMIWEASDAAEWYDRVVRLPL